MQQEIYVGILLPSFLSHGVTPKYECGNPLGETSCVKISIHKLIVKSYLHAGEASLNIIAEVCLICVTHLMSDCVSSLHCTA